MTDVRIVNTIAELDQTIADNALVLVEFGASWCGPCRQFLPHLTRFAEKHSEVLCATVDIEVVPEVVDRYDIMSVPQVFLFRNGEFEEDVNRARTVISLERALDEYLGV